MPSGCSIVPGGIVFPLASRRFLSITAPFANFILPSGIICVPSAIVLTPPLKVVASLMCNDSFGLIFRPSLVLIVPSGPISGLSAVLPAALNCSAIFSFLELAAAPSADIPTSFDQLLPCISSSVSSPFAASLDCAIFGVMFPLRISAKIASRCLC